jgi:uncharacterized protein (TIGR02271 family)
MAQTVVGMFDNSSEAQQAVQKLVDSGITRSNIDVSSNSGSTGTSYSSDSSTKHDHEEGNAFTRFFKNLFSDDDDEADKYSRVASKSQCIVTVHAQSNDEAERAADILDDNGAVNVDERASEYGYSKSGSTSWGSTNTGRESTTDNLGDTGLGNRTGSFGDTSKTVGAFDTGTSAGVTGSASTAGNYTANDLDSTSDLTNADRTDRNYTNRDITSDDTSKKIPIIEENLDVSKQEVRSGGVRLRSRIVERPVEESVRLREERVNVERNNVDRPATEADFANFEERDIEMVERAEVPVVNKQARVVEEVSLNKEVEERSETVSDTVRKTEVDVENLDKGDVRTTGRNDI